MEFLLRRLAALEPDELEALEFDEVMARMYMQGVEEVLEAFDLGELSRALAEQRQGGRLDA